MTAIRIDLGSIQFNTDVADGNGIKWYVTEIDGWDAPDVSNTLAQATQRHGGIPVSGLFQARSVIIRGVFKAPGETTFWTAFDALNTAISNLFTATNMLVQETVLKRLGVIRGGRVRIRFNGAGSGVFEIPLLAPDPFKYSDVEVSTALPATITNDGNFESWPVLTVTGAGSNAKVTNTTQGAGAILDFGTNVLPVGTVIDLKKRTVLSGEVDNYSFVQPGSVWWSLLSGANVITVSGTAVFSLAHRHVWI